jgi:hypothetical protein
MVGAGLGVRNLQARGAHRSSPTLRLVEPRCSVRMQPERANPSPSDGPRVLTTDAWTPVPGFFRASSDPRSTPRAHGKGSEVAQRVWQRSLELAGPGRHLYLPDQALALARTAGHDPDTMTHALRLGRSQARHPSNNDTTRRGVRLLERAIAYLGVRAPSGEIARTGPRRAATLRAQVALRVLREGQHHATDNDRRPVPTPPERQSSPLTESWPPQPVPPPEPVPPPSRSHPRSRSHIPNRCAHASFDQVVRGRLPVACPVTER